MRKNSASASQEKKDTNRQTAITSLLIFAIFFVADLYVMINTPGNLVALAVITILLLVSVYFFINAILREIGKSKEGTIEQYENILKSEKASYLLLKKAFDQMSEIEENTKDPSEGIIAAQKALAKVTINRSKENADAVMNSNDKVLEKIYDFEEKLGANHNELLDRQKYVVDDSMKELLLKQQELASNLEEMKNEFLEAVNQLSALQMSQPDYGARMMDENPAMNDMSFFDTETVHDMGLGIGESAFADEASEIGGSAFADEEPEIGESAFADAGLNLGESTLTDDFSNLGESSLMDDLSSLGESSPIDDLSSLGESSLMDDLSSLGESSLMDDLSSLGESSPIDDLSSLGESSPIDDLSSLGESSPMDDLSSLGESSLMEELENDEKSAVAEEPEKSSMPDLSNLNKLMTPEEIAALIANM